MREHNYYVYIISSNNRRVIYIGVTNDLERRMYEHKNELIKGFTSKYKCKNLVYYEHYNYIWDAISREKLLKGWVRRRKDELIGLSNPSWVDICQDWDYFK